MKNRSFTDTIVFSCAQLIVYAIALSLFSSPSHACSAYSVGNEIQIRTVNDAIDDIKEGRIYPTTENFERLQFSILRKHDIGPKGHQRFVSRHILYEYCLSLQAAGYRERQRKQKVHLLKQKIFRIQPYQPEYWTTRASEFKTFAQAAPLRSAIYVMKRPLLDTLNSPMQFAQFRATSYLREAPYVVTDSNKYFVIVASAISASEARSKMYELKRRNPNFDFVVYAPYGNNPYRGIMMASWVDRATAHEVRALARRYVASDSYIWACKSEGRFC